jgi:hypothetical protein
MAPPPKKLRSASDIQFVGVESDKIPASRLPTVREVLCYFFHLNRHGTLSRRDAARITIREVTKLWVKTKIPLAQEIKAIEKLEKFYEDWRKVNKDAARHVKGNQAAANKVMEFSAKLDSLFDLSVKDAIIKMEISASRTKNQALKEALLEDIEFLRDQRGLRLYTIGGVDLRVKMKEKEEARRKEAAEQRTLKMREHQVLSPSEAGKSYILLSNVIN